MPSYERILSGSALKPGETKFFTEHCRNPPAEVIPRYRAEFPHSKRSSGAIEEHCRAFRGRVPQRSPSTTALARDLRGGQKSVKLDRLNVILLSSTGRSWVLKIHSVSANYPLRENRTTTFPVSLAQLGDRDPFDQATILEIFKEILLDAKGRIPDFEALWAAAGLARTPLEIAADTDRLAAWRNTTPLALIKEIAVAFQDLINRDPDAPIWNVKLLLEMGILGQIDYWVRAADARIAHLKGIPSPEPQQTPKLPPPPTDTIGVPVTVGDLTLAVTEHDGGMWLVVVRDPPDAATLSERVQYYICAAQNLDTDLFDPCEVLNIWVRKLGHAQKGIPQFEAAWVTGVAAAGYDLLPRQVISLLEKAFFPKNAITNEILPRIPTPDSSGPQENRLYADAARATFEIGLYARIEETVAGAENEIARIKADRKAAKQAVAAEPSAEPQGTPSYPETFVADYGGIRVRYQAIEVLPALEESTTPP